MYLLISWLSIQIVGAMQNRHGLLIVIVGVSTVLDPIDFGCELRFLLFQYSPFVD